MVFYQLGKKAPAVEGRLAPAIHIYTAVVQWVSQIQNQLLWGAAVAPVGSTKRLPEGAGA